MSSVIRELDVDNRCSPKASSYDRFSAGLVASILLSGFVVLSLLMVWLFGNSQPHSRLDPKPLTPVKHSHDEDDGDLEHDLDDVAIGSGETELVSLVESVEDAVSSTQSDQGRRGDNGSGLRDRGTIPRRLDPLLVPPSRRWKISYEVEDIEQYKRQLDFFEIEIGVIASSENDIWRVGTLASDAKVTPSSRAKEQDSVWFAHSKPALKRWDRKIAKESGLAVQEMLFVQFYPASVQAQIAELEAAQLKELGRELDEVLETNLKISRLGDGFAFSVSGFEFR